MLACSKGGGGCGERGGRVRSRMFSAANRTNLKAETITTASFDIGDSFGEVGLRYKNRRPAKRT
jgi:hypothetical protein